MAAALTIPACPARTRAAETTGTEKKNEAVSSTADAIMTADQSAPAEYEEYSDIEVYGNKDTSFLLSEQNELFFYRTTAENKDGKNYDAQDHRFEKELLFC